MTRRPSMRLLVGLALLAMVHGTAARAQAYQAGHSAPIDIATGTTTQLVALAAGKGIYVTSFLVFAGGTGNITFEYGTGSNCASGTTALTGPLNFTAQTGAAPGNGTGAILFVPAGNALCALTTASVQISGYVSYSQQ